IANRRDGSELSDSLVRVAALPDARVQAACLRGFRASFRGTTSVALTEAARTAVKKLALRSNDEVRTHSQALVTSLRLESTAERQARLAGATRAVSNVKLSVDERLTAVAQLAGEDERGVTDTRVHALASSTAEVREAILNAIFSRRDRLPALMEALEKKTVPVSFLDAVQRAALLEAKEPGLRKRAAALLKAGGGVKDEVFRQY